MPISRSIFLGLALTASAFSLPLSFEQRDARHFLARFQNSTAEFRTDGILFRDVTVRFVGASPQAELEGLGPAASSTYLRAGFSRTFSQFPKLAIRGLYPGVDAIFYGAGDHLEYDLEVAAGASTDQIRIVLEGARNVRIDDRGDLIIRGRSGEIRQLQPRALQQNHEISARYLLAGANEVRFQLGPYDRRAPLTVDPELVSVKYFGGSGSSSAYIIASDVQGNLYVGGSSSSVNFPTTSNGLDRRAASPLHVLSNGGKTIKALQVASETSVSVVGGSSNGKVLYANTLDGVFVSGDSGATWQPTSPFTVAGPPVESENVNFISLDSLDPATVLVATNVGVFGTDSGGELWGARNTGLPVSNDGYVSASTVFFNPSNPLIAYAATNSPSFFFVSQDAGNTWRQISPSYPGEPEPPTDPFPNVTATITPNGHTLYVIDGNGILFKSNDAATWTKLATGFFNTNKIQIDPANPNTIYVLDQVGLHASTNGGVSFSSVTTPANLVGMAVDSSGALYVATSNLIYVSTNNGKTFSTVSGFASININSLSAAGGNVYVGSSISPVPFVVKLDPTGSNILYSTFLGGSVGDGITGIAIDSAGNPVAVGSTSSPDFPFTRTPSNPPTPVKSDGFIAKLNAQGTHLIYSVALGGSGSAGIQAVALDASANVFVTGEATTADFPTTAKAFQTSLPSKPCDRSGDSPFVIADLGGFAFASKLKADASALEYSTFLAGACGSVGNGIAVDASGNAIVVGYTTSPDFPVSSNTYQPAFPGPSTEDLPPDVLGAGFATKLDPTGDKIIAGTFLGGGYTTQANAVVLDASGNPYITGFTQGFAPGATPGVYQNKIVDRCAPIFSIGPSIPNTGTGDAFVLKLDSTLTAAQFLTYLGGSCNDSGSKLAFDAMGDIWVTGISSSPDFPLSAPFQATGGNFITELSPDASQLLFSSFSNGNALAINSAGVFLAGSSGNLAAVARIDPSATPPVVINSVKPVIAFPPGVIQPAPDNIAPGLLIQIDGSNLGPATKLNGQPDASGHLPFVLGDTIVFFDNIPAPLMSVDASSIVCFVPFEVTSPTTEVSVLANGQMSSAVTVGVVPSAPQILSIVNQNGTVNSAANPAKPGSVVMLFVSGLGQTNPPGDDGLTNTPPLAVPVTSIVVYIAGTNPPVATQFVGAAPGMIAGITQINVPIPSVVNVTGDTTTIGVNSATATLYVSH